MTSTTSCPRTVADGARDGAVSVAVLGPAAPPASDLCAALLALPAGSDRAWTVCSGDASGASPVSVVVCDSAAGVAQAAHRWPTAATIVLVPAYDDGQRVTAALDAGATTCVRGYELEVIAAYVHAIARRDAGPETGATR